jgi:hypothetical protein
VAFGDFATARDTGRNAGVAQLVEHQLPKLRVAGSSPVSRSAVQFSWTAENAMHRSAARRSLAWSRWL